MNISNARPATSLRSLLPLLLLVLVAGALLGYGANAFLRERRLADVAERGVQVMPFDLDRTTHVFERQAKGGLQTVTADDPADGEQIALIRSHLSKEAEAFRRGDFSDPASIHGEDMPGLKELRAGASRMQVQYSEVPAGAQILYVTDDPALVHALHRWFDAQLSDHGQHAQPGMNH